MDLGVDLMDLGVNLVDLVDLGVNLVDLVDLGVNLVVLVLFFVRKGVVRKGIPTYGPSPGNFTRRTFRIVFFCICCGFLEGSEFSANLHKTPQTYVLISSILGWALDCWPTYRVCKWTYKPCTCTYKPRKWTYKPCN